MTFEERFFGLGNRLRWSAIQAGDLPSELKDRLGPFLDDLHRNPEVLVLPRVYDDGRVQWYILCASGRVARSARDELRAFLGPSYSDFEGQPIQLDPSDSVEAAVLDRCGANAFRVEVPDRELLNAARGRLRLLTRLRDERPVRHARRIRATGRVLRDFEYALLTRDGQAASECIAELQSTGRLGATNLLFLEVRRLAALGKEAAVLAMPEFGSLLAMARPRRVTEALIRAVYAGRLRDFAEQGNSEAAIELFRVELLPQYRELYRSRVGLSGHEVDASFLLAAVCSDPPRHEVAEAIVAAYGPGKPHHAFFEAIASTLLRRDTKSSADPLQEARLAFATADVDRAYELAERLPPSFDRGALLLRCARDMGSLAAARVALRAVDDLSDVDRERIRQSAILARMHAALADLATGPTAPSLPRPATAEEVPSSWVTWLRRLAAPEKWRAAVAVAETGSREWSIDALAGAPELISETADLLLTDRPEWGQAALRDALPHLLEFFLSRGADVRLKVLFENLFLAIALDDQVSLSQLAALIRVAEVRLELGVSVSDYKGVVQQLATALEAVGSPSAASTALEAADALVNAPCPDPNARQGFVLHVAAFFTRWYRRIDAAQWALLHRLSEELGVPRAARPQPDDDSLSPETQPRWRVLAGKRIALYSLRESALRRVEAILQDLCPGVQVQIFKDHVGGSPALRVAASTADLFVLATASAKHAATIYIEAHRPKTLATVYARGQGSASLLDALRAYVE